MSTNAKKAQYIDKSEIAVEYAFKDGKGRILYNIIPTVISFDSSLRKLQLQSPTAIISETTIPDYTLPQASGSALGGIKTGFTQVDKNYPVKLDSSGNAYVSIDIEAPTIYTVSGDSYTNIVGGTKIMAGGTLDVVFNVNIPSPYTSGGTYYWYEWSGVTNITNATRVIQQTLDDYMILKITNPKGNVTLTNTVTKKSLVLPSKGDLITMNLGNTTSAYGTLHQYRVLKQIEGTKWLVVAMYEPTTSQQFNPSGSGQGYSGSVLDTYLNSTFYSSLSEEAKNAIVDQTITQYKYSYNSSALTANHRSYADYSTKAVYASSLSRHIFALDVEDIEEYFGGTGGSADKKTAGSFTLAQLMTLFYKSTSTISSKYFWLRSARTDNSTRVWDVYGDGGYVRSNYYYDSDAVRPAFVIDLSKISWSTSN